MTPIDRDRVRARLIPDLKDEEDEIKIPPSDGRTRPTHGLGQGPSGGEGARVIGPVLRRLIELAYELWPAWGSAPMDVYLAPLAEIDAPLEQLERYLRAQAAELLPPPRGVAGCPPRLAGAAATCRGWLRSDNARQAKRAARVAQEKAEALRALDVNKIALPPKPDLGGAFERLVASAPGSLDPHPSAGLPHRRPFAPMAATPLPPRVSIAPPRADGPGRTLPPDLVAELQAAFRAQGVDSGGRRQASIEPEKVGGLVEAVYEGARPK